MTHKYERQCWYCKSKNMERLTNHAKCLDCGATWNIVEEIGPPIIEPGNVVIMQKGEPVSIRATHPTPIIQQRAARARKSKRS